MWQFPNRFKTGFTLAELLIALAVLGVIATFTIPKVLTANQTAKNTAMAKEVMGMISGAYDAYKMNNTVTSSFRPRDLTPYMNYVRVDTVSSIDARANSVGSFDCFSSGYTVCLVLHNGGVLGIGNNQFGNTASTNAVIFTFDPDNRNSGDPGDSASKSVGIFLTYPGRITTRGTMGSALDVDGTIYSASCTNCDPVWLSWN